MISGAKVFRSLRSLNAFVSLTDNGAADCGAVVLWPEAGPLRSAAVGRGAP